MARLMIVRDAPPDDKNAVPRRRSIALRLDGRAWLRVEPEVINELGLADGDEVDDARRAAVEDTLARARARLFVVRSLAARQQSVAELEAKLAARGIPEDVARETLERVAGYGYLDDEELAAQLARGMHARGYGRRRAGQKLRSRGISSDLARTALDDVYGDGDEAALARAALGGRPVSDDVERRRAVAFLARRGFSAGAAWKAVRAAAAEH